MSRRRQANAHTAAAPTGETIARDVLIIGAGLAGINTAYRLQTRMPHLNFAILEARSDIGGTWDVFRYPGVRSDSDMYTFGFPWHPWRHKLFGEGHEIMSYLHECLSKYGLHKCLSLNHKVVKADWLSETQRWTVQVDHDGQPKTYASKWLILSTGLFDYYEPFPAVIPGIDNFQGKVIHPLFWPADYDYTGKKMVIIGSGATAIGLLPALAKNGAQHVTMLQRSPSYVVSTPNPDIKPGLFGRLLPTATLNWLHHISWNVGMALFISMCSRFPSMMRKLITDETRKQLPAKTPLDPHFVPAYNPWEQRLLFSPDGDFYRALHTDKADVVTGTIRTVTADGIRLDDGTALEADVIMTATGWKMNFAGGIPITVDEKPVEWPTKLLWNGCMVQDVPNLFFNWGYTNAAWTLGADETALIMCRLLKQMEGKDKNLAVPRTPDGFETEKQAMWKLSSTYASAGNQSLPKYGNRGPWRPRGNVLLDLIHARWGNVTEGLQFFS